MDVIEALESRHSTRAFKSEPVDINILNSIMEAAKYTPSWANTQPWEVFIGIGEPLERLRRRFVECYRQGVPMDTDIPFQKVWPNAHQSRISAMGADMLASLGIDRADKEARGKVTERNYKFFDAPSAIFVCMNRSLSQWSMFDLGCFSQSIMLAAQHHGLNSIAAIAMAAYPKIIREELEIPEEFSIVIGIALGYGDADSIQNKHLTTRRSVDEFVRIIGQ